MEISKAGNYLEGKKVALCIGGGIAATEDIKLARMLRRYGAEVTAYFTPAALKFVTETSMEWATGNKVVKDLTGASEHLSLEDIVVIAPATCDTIGKIANGIADNAVTAKVLTALGRKTPVLFAPAMNMVMAESPFFCANLGKLVEYAKMVDPRLDYREGIAKMADTRTIAAETARAVSKSKLKGKKILVTAGPAPGKIDDTRIMSNIFRGRLGLKIAEEAYLRGADVKLIMGPSGIKAPSYIQSIAIRDYDEYYAKVFEELKSGYNIGIFSAAVADYLPERQNGKIPSGTLDSLALHPSRKVIDDVRNAYPNLFMVTFKLEAGVTRERLEEIALKRLEKYPVVVANRLEDRDEGRIIYTRNASYVVNSKQETASKLITLLEEEKWN